MFKHLTQIASTTFTAAMIAGTLGLVANATQPSSVTLPRRAAAPAGRSSAPGRRTGKRRGLLRLIASTLLHR